MNRSIPQLIICAIALLALLSACSSEREIRISALHHFERGNAAYEQEDYRGAVHHYNVALELDDEISEVHYNLGLSYYRIGEWASAVESLEQAYRITPMRPEIHYNLALAYNKQDDITSAHKHFNTYRELSANAPERLARKASQARAQLPPSLPTPTANPKPARPTGAQARKPAAATAAPAQPQREPNQATRGNVIPSNLGDNGPNPFEGSEKWWTEDLPIQ